MELIKTKICSRLPGHHSSLSFKESRQNHLEYHVTFEKDNKPYVVKGHEFTVDLVGIYSYRKLLNRFCQTYENEKRICQLTRFIMEPIVMDVLMEEMKNSTVKMNMEKVYEKDFTEINRLTKEMTKDDILLGMLQTADALMHMQELGFCHLCINHNNIFFNEEKKCTKLYGAGICEKYDRPNRMSIVAENYLNEQKGLMKWYLPPEILDENNQEYDINKIDVYAWAVTFYCKLVGKKIFGKSTDEKKNKKTIEDMVTNELSILNEEENLSHEAIMELIKLFIRCLDPIASKRPQFIEVVKLLWNCVPKKETSESLVNKLQKLLLKKEEKVQEIMQDIQQFDKEVYTLHPRDISDKNARVYIIAFRNNPRIKALKIDEDFTKEEAKAVSQEESKAVKEEANAFNSKQAETISELILADSTRTELTLKLEEDDQPISDIQAPNEKRLVVTLLLGEKSSEIMAQAMGNSMAANKTLKKLSISNNQYTDNFINCLLMPSNQAVIVSNELMGPRCLEILDLSNTKIKKRETIEQLFHRILKIKTLKVLNLNYCINGIATFTENVKKALKANNTLTHLYLESTKLGHEEAKAISEILKSNKGLVDLNLNNNFLGDEGAEHIAKGLMINSKLRVLRLRKNEIGNIKFIALAEAIKVNKSLKLFDISKNKINTEGAIKGLEIILKNTSLTGIWLRSKDFRTNKLNQDLKPIKISNLPKELREFTIDKLTEKLKKTNIDNLPKNLKELANNKLKEERTNLKIDEPSDEQGIHSIKKLNEVLRKISIDKLPEDLKNLILNQLPEVLRENIIDKLSEGLEKLASDQLSKELRENIIDKFPEGLRKLPYSELIKELRKFEIDKFPEKLSKVTINWLIQELKKPLIGELPDELKNFTIKELTEELRKPILEKLHKELGELKFNDIPEERDYAIGEIIAEIDRKFLERKPKLKIHS